MTTPRYQVDNEDTGSLDILGGLVTADNAFFLMTYAVENQPSLDALAVGECQRRYGATADSKKPASRQPGHDKHQRPVIYRVWRIE